MTPYGKEKEVFVIPYWIENVLNRNKLPLSTVLDLVKLRSITSAEDLVLMILLNKNNAPIYGVTKEHFSLFLHWNKNEESAAIYQQLMLLLPLHEASLEERLFNESNLSVSYANPFQIKDIDYDNFCIVIYPGYFGSPKAAQYQNDLVYQYLKLWYGYSNYDVMARDPLFKRYLSQL